MELVIASGEERRRILEVLGLGDMVPPDKADLLLVASSGGKDVCFGVAHIKASFAERRTDDVPMSQVLLGRGYASPLVTMDCKAAPASRPVNRGELGPVRQEGEADARSAKRLDFERDRKFGACFNYNTNTVPTPAS